MDSLQGHFLVAAPKLVDPNFYHSVALMIEHTEEGALGLILNRPTNRKVQEIWKLIFDETCSTEESLYLGGPVQGPLMALHADPLCSETEVIPGLFLATQREHLTRLLKAEKDHRIFTGYAGWGGGQLEHEMEAGGWLTAPATREQVFADVDPLWEQMTRAINLDILLPRQKRRQIPDDPSMN